MIRSFLLGSGLILVVVIPAFCQQTLTGTLVHDNVTRNYRLRLPKNFSPAEKLPLVFNFHGFTSNATQQELYSNMNPVADTARFAVCYPNGINAAWNVGWSFGSTADDVGFTEAMIEKFVAEYGFDRDKIYACGMSNGGFFSYHLACNLSDKIAAIASVTGSMVPASLDACRPGRSVPVLEIHGTADDVVQYNGSPNISIPIDTVMAFWSRNNRCSPEVTVETIPDINTTDQSTVEKRTYEDCNQAHEVVLYKIFGGGHTWPGAPVTIGVTNKDIHASTEIWHFFNRFKLNTSTSTSTVQNVIRLYPNPVHDILYIATDEPFTRAEVFSMQGMTMFTSEGIQKQQEIPCQNWPAGMYLVRVLLKDTFIIQKIQKM